MQVAVFYLVNCPVNHAATNPTCYLIALTGAIPRQAQIPRGQQRITATCGSLPWCHYGGRSRTLLTLTGPVLNTVLLHGLITMAPPDNTL